MQACFHCSPSSIIHPSACLRKSRLTCQILQIRVPSIFHRTTTGDSVCPSGTCLRVSVFSEAEQLSTCRSEIPVHPEGTPAPPDCCAHAEHFFSAFLGLPTAPSLPTSGTSDWVTGVFRELRTGALSSVCVVNVSPHNCTSDEFLGRKSVHIYVFLRFITAHPQRDRGLFPPPPRNSPRSITSVCQGRRPGGWELVSHSSVSPQPLVRAAAPPPARPCACSPACGPCLSFPAVVVRRGCPGADDAIVRLRGFTLSRQSSPQQLLESARTLLSHFLRVSGDRQSFRRCSGP